MILLPAIDMKDGRCVRLRKGDFATVHQVADSALDTARQFAAAGARWIHMVDLDGARDGTRKNAPYIQQVAQQSGLRLELGGGIKTRADVDAVAAMGVSRMVIGSAAVSDPALVTYALETYGADRVAVLADGTLRQTGSPEEIFSAGIGIPLSASTLARYPSAWTRGRSWRER